MKNKVDLFTGVLLILCSLTNFGNNYSNVNSSPSYNPPAEHSFRVLCTRDLYVLTKTYAAEYVRLHPEVNITVVQMPDLQKSDILNTKENLFFVSDNWISAPDNDSQWKMVIGREVIVPVISSKNPFTEQINRRGIRSDELADAFRHSGSPAWGTLLGNDQTAPVHYYIVNDESLKLQVADFMKAGPELWINSAW